MKRNAKPSKFSNFTDSNRTQMHLTFKYIVLIGVLIILFSSMGVGQAIQSEYLQQESENSALTLTEKGVSHFAKLALHCIQTEYPNKISHVMKDETDVQGPKSLHPAFYGCFDWHSSVHGHWMLIRLLKRFPDMPEASEIRKKIGMNLTVANIEQEVVYLNHPSRKSFERTYGWAWLLKLAEELKTWKDEDGKKWSEILQPLTDAIVSRYIDFIPRQTYPIRTGVHPNTAFGLSFAWDYAEEVGDEKLKESIRSAGLVYYGNDANCPAEWEPSGEDFLSPCLEEANLMRRILAPIAFRDWLGRFMPSLPSSLQSPALVSDRTDGKIVHLDGLNLSRGWCLSGIANALPKDDPRRNLFITTANKHIQLTVPNIASGDYAGEHWLASFAVYTLSQQ